MPNNHQGPSIHLVPSFCGQVLVLLDQAHQDHFVPLVHLVPSALPLDPLAHLAPCFHQAHLIQADLQVLLVLLVLPLMCQVPSGWGQMYWVLQAPWVLQVLQVPRDPSDHLAPSGHWVPYY